ncbi:MAG: DNA primase [Rhodospirillales bacterium]|jgi:DNA primase|nr:DNA primase [Rhodospirillales bacterium]MBT5075856.1 DNA primase [Rhodospirillales bacterium]MBT5113129.1 DNA primase [Rhodospirillales bacterium]MBT5673005.1 DNA primase [Rhodospirillales bacterium]MBT6187682.1 DNA primase [Rhodospirillales bacterium]
MSFTPRFLDEIRARIGLAERISRKVKLVKRGREYSGLCPFHNEKSPSFTVNEDKGFYHCFGCGAHGDVIGFVMHTDNLSFPEAVERLADDAGIEVPVTSPEERQRAEVAVSLYSVTEKACAWFESELRGPRGGAARKYLLERGLDGETVARFRIGFAPDSRDALKTALVGSGVTESLLVTSGLLIQPDEGRSSYDRFRGRVIFPIFDRRGRPVAFGGRILGDGTPKYLNSPETPLFQKGNLLYGWSHALKGARETGNLAVTEGYMDVIALIRAGIPAMAPLGTALTEAQIVSLWRVVDEPVLCFDGDAAGQRASLRAAERALPLLKPGSSFRFVTLPPGEDPDSLVKSRGGRGIEALMETAKPLAEVIWGMETMGKPIDTPERRALVEKNLMARARSIEDQQVQEYYVQHFRKQLRDAFSDFTPVKGARRPNMNASRLSRLASDPLIGTEEGRAEARERVLVATVLNHPALLGEVAEDFISVDIGSHELDSLRQAILDVAATEDNQGADDLDAAKLARGLSDRGFGRVVDGLGGQARVLDWFARPSAAVEDALKGFQKALELHRHFSIGRTELTVCESAFAENPTEENWLRLQNLKKSMESNLIETEGDEDFGPASGRNATRTGTQSTPSAKITSEDG